uniref:BTB domain-containing protein n=1 Tax=Elaeophora elaphi TaxID=1147741 RepID=A0A158Q7K0_9BILA
MSLQDEGQRLTWNPTRFHVLAHRIKLSRFLDRIQTSNEHPKPDISIMVLFKLSDNTRILLHSEIALAHSGYLRRQYLTAMKAANGPVTLNINDLASYDANAVRRMINFLYTAILPCALAEIPELLALSCKLQIPTMRSVIEKFIIQKAADHDCLLDCWNITCHGQSDISLRTKDFVLNYVMQSLEDLILDVRFPQLDQGAVEELLKRDSLPIRSECDVLRIALMYYIRRDGQHVNMQSLLNVVRYNCGNETLIRMRQDIISVNDGELRFCFEQNCAYGLWQTERHLYDPNLWPVPEMLPPRGNPNASCDWINAQFYNMVWFAC